MKEHWLILGLAATFTSYIYAQGSSKAVVCYMAAWSVGRPGLGKFSVLDADSEHCTHIIYAFMGLDEATNEIKSIDPYIDLDAKGLGQNQLIKLQQLKITHPNIKLLVSVGGWNEGGKKFSVMAASAEKRLTFINSVKHFLSRYELDGLDICWQFPGTRGGAPEDKENSIILFQEIKKAFEWENWLLTVHIIGKRYVMDSYNLKEVSDIVDFINLAPFEYNGPWERKTGPMAPLISKNELNVNFAVDYMLKEGVAHYKLLLGLPTYGHAYLLPEPVRDNYIGLFSNQTFASQWTQESGIIGYNEICYDMKNNEGWHTVWDIDSQTPFAYKGDKLISYDNKRSLLLKAELVNSKMLGGVMIWSLDMDDFHGVCHGVDNFLVTTIANYINIGNAESTSPEYLNQEKVHSTINTDTSLLDNAESSSITNTDILNSMSTVKPELVNQENYSSTSRPDASDEAILLYAVNRVNKLDFHLHRDISQGTSSANNEYSEHKIITSFLLSYFFTHFVYW